jgi:hypothetical protein
MLEPDRLEYPSSILRKKVSLDLCPEIDFVVEEELARCADSGCSSRMLFLLVLLPCKLEPGVRDESPHSVSTRELPHCHAISGPLSPLVAMSARCFGGGSRGGTESLIFGIGIGTEVEDRKREELKLGGLQLRNLSGALESWTWSWGRDTSLNPR